MSKLKDWTGERLETYVYNETTIEHLHRYAIAMELSVGKKVLDIACGEGYGSNLLASKALNVTGMDIDKSSIEKAKKKYSKTNIEFKVSSAEKISAPDNEFDIVVSFETIEHLHDHHEMVKEIKRVLKDDGILLISTPEKKTYSDKNNYKNKFHVKELYETEFYSLLKSEFTNVNVHKQYMLHSSFINTSTESGLSVYAGDFEAIEKNSLSEPLYLIALASEIQLPAIPNSLFSGNSIVEQGLLTREEMVINTITYRLGHFLLYPFKLIRKFLKK